MPDPNQPNPSHPKSIAETLASFANLSASFQKLQSDFNSSKPTDRVTDWAPTASQCLERTVDFVVVYNPKTTSQGVNNYQFQVIAHACRISETEVIAAKEAYDFAVKLARLRSGKIMIVCEMQWFDFEPDAVDETSGLILCGNLKRDEASWEDFKNMWMIRGLKQETPTKFSHVKGSMMPYIGNEICFAHTGEAENIWPGTLQLTAKQFDTSQISHFQKPADMAFAFKSFVTGVLPSRILYPGSPVFDRGGTLLGLIAKTDHFHGDAGRRAVVKSLLAHPWFKEKS